MLPGPGRPTGSPGSFPRSAPPTRASVLASGFASPRVGVDLRSMAGSGRGPGSLGSMAVRQLSPDPIPILQGRDGRPQEAKRQDAGCRARRSQEARLRSPGFRAATGAGAGWMRASKAVTRSMISALHPIEPPRMIFSGSIIAQVAASARARCADASSRAVDAAASPSAARSKIAATSRAPPAGQRPVPGPNSPRPQLRARAPRPGAIPPPPDPLRSASR